VPSAGHSGHPERPLPDFTRPRTCPRPPLPSFSITTIIIILLPLPLSSHTHTRAPQVGRDARVKSAKLQNRKIVKPMQSAYPVATLELPHGAAEVRGPAGREDEGGKEGRKKKEGKEKILINKQQLP
jgi:hypothetical protein